MRIYPWFSVLQLPNSTQFKNKQTDLTSLIGIGGNTIDFLEQFIITWLTKSQSIPRIKSKLDKGRQIKSATKDLPSIWKWHFEQHWQVLIGFPVRVKIINI